jgi:D-tyrosyl-tRNA(Tyr) deacylase
MRALVQRVSRAAVRVEGQIRAEIGPGVVVLLGIAAEDDEAAADRLAAKVLALRIFADADGHMNEALGGREILCVSQFTLYADTRRGNRPSFMAAARPELAEPMYERFCAQAGAARGVFGAHMVLELVNDGPVTVMLET